MYAQKCILVIALFLYCLFFAGCSTPEGGSSLPWSRPEQWETQSLPSFEEE